MTSAFDYTMRHFIKQHYHSIMIILHYVYGANLSVLLYTSTPVLDEMQKRNLSALESHRRLLTTNAD